MLALRLPESIENRLNALVQETGRTKSTLAREAIMEYLDDLETITWPRRARVKIARRFRSLRWSARLAYDIEFDPEAV